MFVSITNHILLFSLNKKFETIIVIYCIVLLSADCTMKNYTNNSSFMIFISILVEKCLDYDLIRIFYNVSEPIVDTKWIDTFLSL